MNYSFFFCLFIIKKFKFFVLVRIFLFNRNYCIFIRKVLFVIVIFVRVCVIIGNLEIWVLVLLLISYVDLGKLYICEMRLDLRVVNILWFCEYMWYFNIIFARFYFYFKCLDFWILKKSMFSDSKRVEW